MATDKVVNVSPSAVFRDESQNMADPHVGCPKCGSEYVGVTSTKEVRTKGEDLQALRLTFECENGRHKFHIDFQPHKGVTLLTIGV